MKKLYLLLIIFCGCSINSHQFPSDINIDKNQLIYKDDKMQIWAHDDKGYHPGNVCLVLEIFNTSSY